MTNIALRIRDDVIARLTLSHERVVTAITQLRCAAQPEITVVETRETPCIRAVTPITLGIGRYVIGGFQR
ncbi:MAG: hypothetical protein ACE5NW_06645 [Acidiferrobacterales bacterium]